MPGVASQRGVSRHARSLEMSFAVADSPQPPRYDRCAITRGERWGRLVPIRPHPRTKASKPIRAPLRRSEEHTSELQSLMRISYAVFCWKKKTNKQAYQHPTPP